MDRDKTEWLIVLRRCTSMCELEVCVNQNFGRLSEDELEYFNSAADYRRAELTMGRLFDRVSASVWMRVK